MPQIISRAEARARRLKRYFTGKACKRGHVAERRVSSWDCVVCKQVSNTVWEAANPDKIAVYAHNERARKNGNGGSHTATDLRALWEKQHQRCAYCKIKLTPRTLDHIIPLSKGGTNNPDNLAWVCKPCNSRKGTRSLDVFLRDLKARDACSRTSENVP